LKKPLYGLKQAGRQWKKKLDDTMAHLKFTKSAADECLYILREKGKVILLVLIYVDDAAAASKDIRRIEWFKHSLQDFFPIKDLATHPRNPSNQQPSSPDYHPKSNGIYPKYTHTFWHARLSPRLDPVRCRLPFIPPTISYHT
jgi:hypothetical protein